MGYHKKAIYKFTKKVNKKAAPKKTVVFVEKKVGGAKNGGTRMVRAKKLANDVPTGCCCPWHLQELLFQPREESEGFPYCRHRRYRPRWCAQGQACRRAEAARHWPAPRHRTPQAQRLPTQEGEPEVPCGHFHEARHLQGVCAREHQ